MGTHRIVCVTTQEPHRHIIAVGIGDSAGNVKTTHNTRDIRANIDKGEIYETYSPSTGKTARVNKDTCKIDGCTVETLRSTADAVSDNNLDNLKGC